MAAWGCHYGARLTQALGFRHKPPCAATLHTILRHVDCEQFASELGAWAEEVIARAASKTATETVVTFMAC